MKQYCSPDIKVLEIYTDSVLCASDNDIFGGPIKDSPWFYDEW